MENQDFYVDLLLPNSNSNNGSCIIGWNKSLMDAKLDNQVYKLYILVDNSGSMTDIISDTSFDPPKKMMKISVVKETIIESLLAIRGLSKKTGIKIHVALLTFNNMVSQLVPLTFIDDTDFSPY